MKISSLKKPAEVICLILLLLFALGALTGSIYDNYFVTLSPGDTETEIVAKAVTVLPSSRQVKWQQVEYAMFVHFGMNTFTNFEWGTGKEKPSRFKPKALDARQWARVAKEAGMGKLIFTAKHHDGFCLWPTSTTDHSVKDSPWGDGKRDLVKEIANACRAEGIAFGVYLSPWDRHEPTYGTPAYNDFYKAQLREILTGYGEIVEIWMDGAGMGDKYKTMKTLYDWEGYYAMVRELQPAAVIFNGPDVRWVGNEAGKGRDSEWSVIPDGIDILDRDLGSRAVLMQAAKREAALRWYPSQVDVSIRPGWFYHKHEDFLVRSPKNLTNIYYDSVGGNAQLLLNVPPDRRGLIHKSDVKSLMGLKAYLDRTFDENLATGAQASASSTAKGNRADLTIDRDNDTYWMADKENASLTLELDSPRTFDVIMLQEAISEQSQRIESFTFEVEENGQWKEVASATTVGYKRLLRVEPVTAKTVRINIIGSRQYATLSEVGLYSSQ